MALRRILTVADPKDLAVLKQVSAPVAEITDELRALADDMLETMYAAPGIGLAAAQIGELRRMFVMDLSDKDAPPEPRVFINPEVVWASDELSTYEEGCLSIPDIYDGVERPARVRVRFLDRNGASVEEEAEGLYATCFQHELDHCNGVLFLDHLSRLKRERAISKVKKAKLAA
ncbi:MAG: peptide deformylase [Proteobacteria bacterium]|nr:peptide deformylase [Pseudomonadota bacterium]